MNTTEVLARLTAHWPALGGDDVYADIRLTDWARAVDRFPPDVRAETIRALIVGWDSDWHPMISDWLTAARQAMSRLEMERGLNFWERPALEDRHDDLLGTRARVEAIIRETAEKLSDTRRKTKMHGYDLATPPLSRLPKPTDIPGGPPLGDKHMTPEERQAELDAFGARKVRTKRAEP